MNTQLRKTATGLPTEIKVLNELSRYEAARLFYVVHDVCLVHHIPLAKRDKFFELVCQQLSPNVYPEQQA